jgi:hypothetical protein
MTFVSHAGVRTACRRVVATRETVRLAGLDAAGRSVITPDVGAPFALGDLSLTLVPSGYVPGAVHLLVERPGGRRTLFVSRLGALAAAVPCDVLILDPGPGRVPRAGPPGERELGAWIRGTLDAGEVPVIVADACMLARLCPLLAPHGVRAAGRAAAVLGALASMGHEGPGEGPVHVILPGGRRPRLPSRSRLAWVVDRAAPAPAGAGTVLRLGHTAPLEAYARLVVKSGARDVHVTSALADLPGLATSRTVTWHAPEEQMVLGGSASGPPAGRGPAGGE